MGRSGEGRRASARAGRRIMATVSGFEAYLESQRQTHQGVDEEAVRALYDSQASELRAFWSGVTYSGANRKLPGRAGIKRRPGPTHYNRFCRQAQAPLGCINCAQIASAHN